MAKRVSTGFAAISVLSAISFYLTVAEVEEDGVKLALKFGAVACMAVAGMALGSRHGANKDLQVLKAEELKAQAPNGP